MKDMIAMLDGPRLLPRKGAIRRLVVILHGYGADGNDLIELGAVWQARLPDALFVAPHAPQSCAGAPAGRQWFDLQTRDPDHLWAGAVDAAPALDRLIEAECDRHQLPEDAVALVGFSQGAMMALHVGLRRRKPPGCIVAYSGMLLGRAQLVVDVGARTALPPPTLLIHGDADDVVAPQSLFDAAEGLAEAGVPCFWHLSPGLGHAIDDVGLHYGGDFIDLNTGSREG